MLVYLTLILTFFSHLQIYGKTAALVKSISRHGPDESRRRTQEAEQNARFFLADVKD